MAGGQNWHIGPGGNDSNPGTLALPWATLAHSLSGNGTATNVGEGDFVNFLPNPNRYQFAGFTQSLGGASGQRLTVRSYDRHNRARIQMTSQWNMHASYVNLEDFTFDGCTVQAMRIGVQGGDQAANFTLDRVYASHCSERPFTVANADAGLFRDVRMWDCRSRQVGVGLNGIYCNGVATNIDFLRCVFRDIGSNCIQFEESSGTDNISNVRLINCIGMTHNSSYDLATRPWLDFSDVVGEMLLGCKGVTGPIYIIGCVGYGFYTNQAVLGGDTGGGAQGPVVVILNNDTGTVYIDRLEGYGNGGGLQAYPGTVATLAPIRISNSILHSFVAGRGNGDGFICRGSTSYRLFNSAVYGAPDQCLVIEDTAVDQVENNIFAFGGTFKRNTGNSNEAGIRNNARYGATGAWLAQWDNDNVALTDFAVDAEQYLSGAGNDALGAGDTLVDATYDDTLDLVPHESPPNLGPLNVKAALASGVVWALNSRRGFLDGQFTSILNTRHGMNPHPVEGFDDTFGILIYTNGAASTQQSFGTLSLGDRARIGVYFWIRLGEYLGQANDRINFIKFFDGTIDTSLGYLSLWRNGATGRWHLVCIAFDALQSENYVGSNQGFELPLTAAAVEVQWQPASSPTANNGSVTLVIDDEIVGSITNLNNYGITPDTFQVGAMNFPSTIGGPDETQGSFVIEPPFVVYDDGVWRSDVLAVVDAAVTSTASGGQGTNGTATLSTVSTPGGFERYQQVTLTPTVVDKPGVSLLSEFVLLNGGGGNGARFKYHPNNVIYMLANGDDVEFTITVRQPTDSEPVANEMVTVADGELVAYPSLPIFKLEDGYCLVETNNESGELAVSRTEI